ncbi:MAG: hypothetical protein WC369_05770 [Dehalococcoidales bacterium]|jgi:hypothetical protein
MGATLLTPGQAASIMGEFSFGRARSLIKLAGLSFLSFTVLLLQFGFIQFG